MPANVISWAARSLFQTRLGMAANTANGNVSGEPIYIEWGFANSTVFTQNAAITDVSLFQPAAQGKIQGTLSYQRTSATAFVDTLQVTGTVTANTGAVTINEVGLFDSLVNCASSTLAATANTTQTNLQMTSVSAFPAAGNTFYAQIGNEVVKVTGISGSNLEVTRAQFGTSQANSVYPVGQAVTFGGDGGAWSVNSSISSQSATVNAYAFGGSLVAHADFANIGLSNGDSIAFTLTIQLS